ncbi:MAG: efflux RND transporter permease subunit, partial [Bacteroidales bacterium]|nr:efflux RND transporter permease subunit [Bacteroidales bacterium]
MIGKLIERPIAVTMSIIAIVILGGVATGLIPVSLMPNVDVPHITVQVNAPGYSARELHKNVIAPLKSQLSMTPSLKELSCESNNNSGTIFMEFEPGADIDYLFVDVNERIDKSMSGMTNIERPKVAKASVTDIPAFFINMKSRIEETGKFLDLSRFAVDVVRKRLEQIPEVALVDISGLILPEIIVTPYPEKMKNLGISPSTLESAIKSSNVRLGELSIKDGHYRWNIRFTSEIRSIKDIENIKLNVNGRIYSFSDLASVSQQPGRYRGLVRSDGQQAVSMAIVKQTDSRMSDLKGSVNTTLEQLNKEYPDVDFTITRDQTQLLSFSIS